MDKARCCYVPASLAEKIIENINPKSRSFPTSPARDPPPSISTPLHRTTSTSPHHPLLPRPTVQEEKKKKKHFSRAKDICKVDTRDLEKHHSSQKAILGLPFKIASVDGKPIVDPRNIRKVLGEITCVTDTRSYLRSVCLSWDPRN